MDQAEYERRIAAIEQSEALTDFGKRTLKDLTTDIYNAAHEKVVDDAEIEEDADAKSTDS